jgi:hypothetical protein
MPSSTSSFERLTAADRPGVAQPVPERPVPAQPWGPIALAVVLIVAALMGAWEWRMRQLQLVPGDFDDGASAWAEQRRRIDAGNVAVAIVGDSRILFDTDLAHFEALTGVRPVQLALPGTNGRPFLQDLAADPDFKGLAIVGITEGSYFRDEVGLMADALDTYKFESPAKRSSHLITTWLARRLAFLDEAYRLSVLTKRLDTGWRAGARSPYGEVWKIATSKDERQTAMWGRIETDATLRDHARSVWVQPRPNSGVPVAADVIARTQDATREAVKAIRARGGDVVFVRPPSSPELRVHEDARIPRPAGWDALLAVADVRGVHFDDYPSMQGLAIPEWSHLSRACAPVFTDAYVRALAQYTPRLALRADAPAPMSPADCQPTEAPASAL